ncbi:MAG: RDD family protein [Erythrobacter sp.]
MSSAAALPVNDARRRELITPEGLALPLTLASRGSRAGALLLDVLIIVAGLLAFNIALVSVAGGLVDGASGGAGGGAGEFIQIVLIIGGFLGWYGYFLAQELGPRGATLGKRIMGIRVATRRGERLTPEAVIARNLLRDIEIFYPLVFILVTGLMAIAGEAAGTMIWAAAAWFALFLLLPFFNRDALRAGDIIAGTWVLEVPRKQLGKALSVAQGANAADAAANTQYQFGERELGIYGERELQVLERMLREAGDPALETVRIAICRKIEREPETGAGNPRAFLEAFYAALRAKLEKDMRFGKRKADKFS